MVGKKPLLHHFLLVLLVLLLGMTPLYFPTMKCEKCECIISYNNSRNLYIIFLDNFSNSFSSIFVSFTKVTFFIESNWAANNAQPTKVFDFNIQIKKKLFSRKLKPNFL